MNLYTENYATRAVAGAATPAHGTPRTHAVGRTTGRVVCGTVKPEHILADPHATPEEVLPTCPVCLRALALVLATPRTLRGTK